MTTPGDDQKLAARTRDLLQSFRELADMVALGVPVTVIARQIDELEGIARDVDSIAGTNLWADDIFASFEVAKLMTLYEAFQLREASKAESE